MLLVCPMPRSEIPTPDLNRTPSDTNAQEERLFPPFMGGSTPLWGMILALALGGVVLALPLSNDLDPAAQRLAALFVFSLILWVTEALPIAVTAVLAIALQPLLGIASMRDSGANFMSPVIFFVLAMFLIAAVVNETGLDRRFAAWLLRRAGTNSKRVVLAFMLGTAVASGIVSDVPICAIWATLALTLLKREGAAPGRSNLGKALMIGIPIAAFIGGVGTPAGSSVNILGLQLMEQASGVQVSFLEWMSIGVPMVLILTPAAWWVIVKVFPPELEQVQGLDEGPPLPLNSGEKKVIGLLATMFTLWILSSWWPKTLDVTMIALLGSVLMFAPGFRLLNWPTAVRKVGWEGLLMIGGVTSLGMACRDTGLAEWVVLNSLSDLAHWDPIWVIATISLFTVVVHLVIPILPAVNAVLIPPIVVLAQQSGQPVALYALPVIFTASCGFLLPLDAVSLITYGKRYYSMKDMFIPGAIISLFWVALMTILMVTVGTALDLG